MSSLPVLIGCDEFPVGYSLAGCPPAEPASASPTRNDSQQPTSPYNDFAANGNYPLNFVSQSKGALHAAPFPCTPNPRRTSSASLRTTSPGPSRLTKPNTSCTIITPASLRSDCCSPSLRNAVRLASGIDVHLHRNTHPATSVQSQLCGVDLKTEFLADGFSGGLCNWSPRRLFLISGP